MEMGMPMGMGIDCMEENGNAKKSSPGHLYSECDCRQRRVKSWRELVVICGGARRLSSSANRRRRGTKPPQISASVNKLVQIARRAGRKRWRETRQRRRRRRKSALYGAEPRERRRRRRESYAKAYCFRESEPMRIHGHETGGIQLVPGASK